MKKRNEKQNRERRKIERIELKKRKERRKKDKNERHSQDLSRKTKAKSFSMKSREEKNFALTTQV